MKDLISKKRLLKDLAGMYDVLTGAGDPFLASMIRRRWNAWSGSLLWKRQNGGLTMMGKVMITLGYVVLTVDAAALAFLMSAWIRDRRNRNG